MEFALLKKKRTCQIRSNVLNYAKVIGKDEKRDKIIVIDADRAVYAGAGVC